MLRDRLSIPVADIHGLEYQEDLTGADSAHHPGVLNAVVKRRSICLSPQIDEKQTASIIGRIMDGFPGLRTMGEGYSLFGTNFIPICLNEPSRANFFIPA